jgi:hypothetical protein
MGKIGKLLLIIFVFVALIGSTFYFFSTKNTSNNVSLLPYNANDLRNRLSNSNLPALTTEGTTFHIHEHLDIYINGQYVLVPADIGIDPAGNFISPIHTHDTTGIIHIESPTVQNFTLGQFFNVWGIALNNNCIGNYCNNNNNKLALYINGQPITGNYSDIKLEPYQEIFIFYGSVNTLPKNIPSSYNFPSGY